MGLVMWQKIGVVYLAIILIIVVYETIKEIWLWRMRIISRREMALQAAVHERCTCGEMKMPPRHQQIKGNVLHRTGAPCFNIDRQLYVAPKTVKD